ncbi:Galactose/methyl galactoside import ATP-binding protein MglA [Jannaschia seosinensis]|uniref:Galactose/methyl galactoside import ATP-binding protein MglA n=1 Tax=Jannaschia seosinensis TaxID=313367 RepID=A0A0M7B8B8_9RHOB|nr:Galactose/methyl galactoside import ATP-binding protein MglA [Jannaschia seosinensis]
MFRSRCAGARLWRFFGENGAGKTTLMNVLFGHYAADSGWIEMFGAPLPSGNPGAALARGVGMVHQHFTLAASLSVLDNIVLGTRSIWSPLSGRRAARRKVTALMADCGLRVDPEARIGNLTVGERQRVEILKALYRDARILILDEPTAVLTPQEAGVLFATLRRAVQRGLSVIFISHKLHEVTAICDRVVVLRHGRVAGEAEVAALDRHEIARMMVGAEIPAPVARPARPGRAAITLQGVSTADRGAVPGLRGVDLDLCAGQNTGLAGVTGNGQAALAGLLSGLNRPVEGRMTIHGEAPGDWTPRAAVAAGIARIPEDRHATGTVGDLDLTENAILERYTDAPISRMGWLDRKAARDWTRTIIETYDVRCPGPETPARLLSGGNMQKLILGCVLMTDPGVVLANQPVRARYRRADLCASPVAGRAGPGGRRCC